jgi:putative DNA primase/helicase
MAKLPAARFVTASEFAGKAPLHEARLKQLTGRDPIVARPLYGAPFSFLPQLKLWLSMDQPPQAMDASDGFWQRVRLVPFRVSFAGH